jgi:hypothetical protein
MPARAVLTMPAALRVIRAAANYRFGNEVFRDAGDESGSAAARWRSAVILVSSLIAQLQVGPRRPSPHRDR